MNFMSFGGRSKNPLNLLKFITDNNKSLRPIKGGHFLRSEWFVNANLTRESGRESGRGIILKTKGWMEPSNLAGRNHAI